MHKTITDRKSLTLLSEPGPEERIHTTTTTINLNSELEKKAYIILASFTSSVSSIPLSRERQDPIMHACIQKNPNKILSIPLTLIHSLI